MVQKEKNFKIFFLPIDKKKATDNKNIPLPSNYLQLNVKKITRSYYHC